MIRIGCISAAYVESTKLNSNFEFRNWIPNLHSSSTNGSLSLFRLEEQDKAPTKKRQKRKRNVIPWTLGRSPGKAPLSVYFFVSPQHGAAVVGSVVFVVVG